MLILVPEMRQYLVVNSLASNGCYYTEEWVRIFISVLGFTPYYGGLFMAFKSSVTETEAEPYVLISVKNFPLISMGT